jgi:hypothetical protein
METAIWQVGEAHRSIKRCSVRQAIIRAVLTANLRKYMQRQRDCPNDISSGLYWNYRDNSNAYFTRKRVGRIFISL